MPVAAPTSQYIQTMFDHLASRYDLFNHLTGMGQAGRWRRAALEPVRAGMSVLDLGCGTGDLAIAAIQKMHNRGEVIGLDFSAKMLEFAKKKAQKLNGENPTNIRWVEKKAEDLPLDLDTPYDVAVSGFVLRNLYENIDLILPKVRQALRNGGFLRFLDITEPDNFWVRCLWKIYMNTVVALYGKILFGKDYPILYLTESAQRFARAREFVKKLEGAGFVNVRRKSFMLGMVTLYSAEKP